MPLSTSSMNSFMELELSLIQRSDSKALWQIQIKALILWKATN